MKIKAKNVSKYISICFLFIIFVFSKTTQVKADDWSQAAYNTYLLYSDFGTPSVSYTGTYYNGTNVSNSQGNWVQYGSNSNGAVDDLWLNAIHVYNNGTGGYASLANVSIKAHLHNYGWTDAVNGTSGITGTNYSKYGWIEAIQLTSSNALGQYTYFNYGAVSNPVSWNYLVWKSGGEEHNAQVNKPGDFNEAEKNLLINNPSAKNSWQQGLSKYLTPQGTYRMYFGDQEGAICSNVSTSDNQNFHMNIGGNWAGTEGYSLPMEGFEANLQEYPCNVYINPNGGTWGGTGSTVQVGETSSGSYIHAGDSIGVKYNPTRSGYTFAGWTPTYNATTATATTSYQAPSSAISPWMDGNTLHVGNASSITLVANWNQIQAYSIRFNGNGAREGSMSDMNCGVGSFYSLTQNAFKKYYNVAYDMQGGSASKSSDVANAAFLGWSDHNSINYNGNTYTFPAFNAPYYANKYGDLKAAMGYNKYSLLEHYYNFIINGHENRNFSQYFNLDTYINNYADLRNGFGGDRLSYVLHYMQHGYGEGRNAISTPDTGVSELYPDQANVANLSLTNGFVATLDAAWQDGSINLESPSRPGYDFTGWYDTNGNFVGHAGDTYTPSGDTTLVAHWLIKVIIHYDGNGSTGGSMNDDQKPAGVPYQIKNSAFTKDASEFGGWSTSLNANTGDPAYAPGSMYTTEQSLTLYAVWKPKFDIAYTGVSQTRGSDSFDNNSGADYSQLSGNVALAPNDMGIDTTKSYTDKNDGSTITENITATGVGWAFKSGVAATDTANCKADKSVLSTLDFYTQAASQGAVTTGKANAAFKGSMPALNSGNMSVVNLYRVWDYGPMIEAYDQYYTLADAQSGKITQDLLLATAVATDVEDGTIKVGTNKTNSFTIPDYAPTDFTQFNHDGSVTETFQAVDSVGNITKKMITVNIVDTTASVVKPEGTTRFIDEKYYNLPYAKGGLEDTSIWKTDPAYKAELEQAFSNLKNDTPEESYTFDNDTILKMQKFVDDNGFGNIKRQAALTDFYNQFMAANKK